MKEEVEKQTIFVENVFSNEQKKAPNSFQQNVPGYAVMFAFYCHVVRKIVFERTRKWYMEEVVNI